MFNRLRDYFLRAQMKRLMKLVTENLYSEVSFDAFLNRINPNSHRLELLHTYAAILVAGELTEPMVRKDVDVAINTLRSLTWELDQSSEPEAIMEVLEESAQIAWLERRNAILEAKLAWKMDEYSYEGMIYQIQKAKKGPCSSKERQKFQKLSNELRDAKGELENHLSEQSLKRATEEAIERMQEDIALEARPQTKEELDQERDELVDQIKQSIEESKGRK